MPRFQVVVGNIGTVYDGDSAATASGVFSTYVQKVHENEGRAEWPVTLLDGDEIRSERDSYSCPFCNNAEGWIVPF